VLYYEATPHYKIIFEKILTDEATCCASFGLYSKESLLKLTRSVNI